MDSGLRGRLGWLQGRGRLLANCRSLCYDLSSQAAGCYGENSAELGTPRCRRSTATVPASSLRPSPALHHRARCITCLRSAQHLWLLETAPSPSGHLAAGLFFFLPL